MTTTLDAPFELSLDDVPPDFTIPSGDVSPLRCGYDGCLNEVVKPARGRTPKFCPDHRRETGTQSGKRSASWSGADDVEKILNQYAAGLTFTVTMVNPADGTVLADGFPKVIHELVELGRVDKEWRKYLERISKPGKYGPLTLASLTLIVPIMANHKLLPQFLIHPLVKEGSTPNG